MCTKFNSFSLLHSTMNCRRRYYIICTSPKMCCRITLRNLNVQLHNFTPQLFKRVTNCLFAVNIYRNVIFWITRLCQLVYNIKHAHKISVISMHTCFALCMPFCQWLCRCIVAMLWQACSRHCRNLLCWHDVIWRCRHSGKAIKLK